MKLLYFKTFYVYIYNIIQNRKSLVNLLVKLTDSAKVVKLTVSDNGIIQHFKLQQARDLQFFVSKQLDIAFVGKQSLTVKRQWESKSAAINITFKRQTYTHFLIFHLENSSGCDGTGLLQKHPMHVFTETLVASRSLRIPSQKNHAIRQGIVTEDIGMRVYLMTTTESHIPYQNNRHL